MLDGKVILVTGAGGGIGRDIALAAAAEGAAVVVNDIGASLSGDTLTGGAAQAVVDEITAMGGKALANTDSVSDPEAARNMIAETMSEYGRLDSVVNNAGITRDGFFHKMDEKDFDAVLKVHLYGSFNVSRAAAEVYKAQQSGSFIHMTSTSGLIGNLAQANYSAAKMGIAALSKSIALDMQRWGVRSNCVAPFAWSRMTSAIKVDSAEQEARVAKLKEMKAAKIAPLVIYLSGDRSSDVTGQIFSVRNNEIFLISQPRPVRSVHRSDGWSADSIADHAIPALRASFHDLDVSADVFSWDPI
ncbi:SDR family NAD(P)-dependent oxidoreductase [Thalassovita taeanensis]|uniref:NAD(P)-dependent dehydrogenase, short-chain alcohol dehydrogenase family n=1 Tax=Thalassovita taeanensis TaxID=657014 RepID=A0A1H9H954_9RHOB|nr:SDR family NAD(P)-dependent oxidoreductase [Thalassovita taeanensis]SEQ58767.1 NAD(P)-dependent dehydrogenase, short-chain alcohol dehydrogenase family [Thalassovita taeanensis]